MHTLSLFGHVWQLFAKCKASLYTDMCHIWNIHIYYTGRLVLSNTGRFIMSSAITNFYNKKTKGNTLMELFTATRKTKTFFLATKDVRCVHHGWHGTHRYDIQVADACVATTWLSYRCVPCHPWCTHQTSLVVKKKKLFRFSCGCEQFH